MSMDSKWWARLSGAAAVCLLPAAASAQSAFEQLVAQAQAEVEARGGKLAIAMDWTEDDAAAALAAFQAEFPWITEIEYTRETGVGPFGRYLIEIQQGILPPYDIMHVASEFEQQYWDDGAFVMPPFDYNEVAASLPADWPAIDPAAMDPEGRFLATTGNTRGIAWNPELVGDDVPTTWADCADPKWRGQVVMDARNKGQAFQYDAQERERHIAWLHDMRDNETVFERGQSRVLQAVAAGEYAIACLVNFHTTQRMIERDGVTTLQFGLGESIPLELASRLFVLKGSETPATVQLFAVWTVTKGQTYIDETGYRGFPWIAGTRLHDAAEGKYIALCDAECANHFEEYNAEYIDILGFPAALAEE
ncbi:MAG: extracellular solute-binding protein [Alphaproteobacteria bacterium]